jgi:hypothetical protein
VDYLENGPGVDLVHRGLIHSNGHAFLARRDHCSDTAVIAALVLKLSWVLCLGWE